MLGFDGVESIDEAERLAGPNCGCRRASSSRCRTGEYYHHQLIGCEVVTDGGETIGRVTAVEGERAPSRLVVTGPRREVLIPLAEEICTVDVAAKRIVVTPPEGLLELNGEWR